MHCILYGDIPDRVSATVESNWIWKNSDDAPPKVLPRQ